MSLDRPNACHKVILVGGGVRSGKSSFALGLARRLGQRRVLIATAEPLDAEMRDRIAEHRRERGADFDTVEAPLELCAVLERVVDTDVVVIDCLTLWLSNLLLRDQTPARLRDEIEALSLVLEARRFHSVVVTNEVGMGIVPESALGRAFRDLSGRAHQRISRAADEIYFAVLGSMLRLRPAPIVLEGDRHATPG